jgi:nitroreductase
VELVEAVRRDRATREFADRSVDRSTVEALVDAARRAGSGHNRQPWTFVAVTDPDRRDELAEFGSYTTPLRNAPLGIVMAVDRATRATATSTTSSTAAGPPRT